MQKLSNVKLNGQISLPQSKTHIHRILFIKLIQQKEGYLNINNSSFLSNDIQATLNVLKAFNCLINYDFKKEELYINSKHIKYNLTSINCIESGTTLRVAIIIALFVRGEGHFEGSPKLMSRPLDFYEKLFLKNNIKFQLKDNKLFVKGDLSNIFTNGKLSIENCKSSQFITALMLVVPYYKNEFTFEFVDNIESVAYLKVTASILEQFNIITDFIYTQKKLKKIKIKHSKEIGVNLLGVYNEDVLLTPEIDYSSYAFWAVANELGANIIFQDKIYTKVEKFIHPDQEIIHILKNQKTKINLEDCPDLLPILLVWSSLREGIKTIFINFQRNRLKESNRVEGMTEQLIKLGANIVVEEEKIEVIGRQKLLGGEIDTLNDHRIAMAFAICSLKVKGELIINNETVVEKSYYNFWEDFYKLRTSIKL